jgi:hypothetical protein
VRVPDDACPDETGAEATALGDAISVIVTVTGAEARCVVVRRQVGRAHVSLRTALACLEAGVHGVVRWNLS